MKNIDEQFDKILNSNKILKKEDKENIDSLIESINNFYKTEIPSDKVEREKVYLEYVSKIEEFGKTLSGIVYSFQLSKEEYLFLKDTLLKKLEYDRENVFIALLIRDNFFYKYDTITDPNKTSIKMEDMNGKFVTSLPININDLTRISHLLGMYTIKDIISKKADIFASCIGKIGDISKIFNYYKTKGEQLQNGGDNWLKGFEVYDEDELNETGQTLGGVIE